MSISKAAALSALLATSSCATNEQLTPPEWDERYRQPISVRLSPEEAARVQDLSDETRVHLSKCIANTKSGMIQCTVIEKDAPHRPFHLSY